MREPKGACCCGCCTPLAVGQTGPDGRRSIIPRLPQVIRSLSKVAMPVKKLSRRQAEANPAAAAKRIAAIAEAKAQFGSSISALRAEIQPLLAARRAGPLHPVDELWLRLLKVDLVHLDLEQSRFVEARLSLPRIRCAGG